ncbi:MAG: RNA-binding S4 domain-containing protein [Lysobacterales bacterium]
MSSAAAGTATVRLDQWLWAARWYRTRALAKQAVEQGRVQVNEQVAKPARLLKVGDRIELVREQERYRIEVSALALQRGPAPVAQSLYREDDDSRDQRLADRERRRMQSLGMQPPEHKPDKRARRLLLALGDIDANS